ncbi:MAG: PEP-utilizing enzyme [Armatimonadota bacterium]|nr:PEP-utilizing enzyme [Armatimonadota bacterium]
MVTTRKRFPYPWEVETPKGAEGWERMYPYYLLSSEETRAHEQSLFWFQDKIHHAYALYPFDVITFEAWRLALGQYNTRVFGVPPALGIDHRVLNGYLYIAPVPVADPEEVTRRVGYFQKRAGYYFEHWNELFDRWRPKAEAVIREMEKIAFRPLPAWEPEEVVFEGRGRSSGYDLLASYSELINRFFLMWQYHFEMLNLGYVAYLTFFQFCKTAFPDIPDQTIARMVAGIDVLLFRPDEELKGLARKAVELQVAEAFTRAASAQATLQELEHTDNGRQWLRALDQVKYPWFYYSSEYGFYHDQPSWIDDLSIPFSGIRGYIERLQRGEDISRPTQKLLAEREQLAQEYRALLRTDQDRQQFDQLVGLARTVFPYIEDHNFFVEHWSHTIFWQKMRDLGQVLVEAGFLTDREDVFYLNRHEVAQVVYDVASSWAVGVRPVGVQRWRDEVQRRREILQVLREWTPVPGLGEPPETVTEPFTVMLWGIISNTVKEWLEGPAERANELRGFPASPGVAEGPARLIRAVEDIGQVQPGEILVCPMTSPSWAPVFSLISGTVSDIGGMMCHAAIVSREYGLPAVVGTGFATTAIKTGQRVRVDGNQGVVTILSAS